MTIAGKMLSERSQSTPRRLVLVALWIALLPSPSAAQQSSLTGRVTWARSGDAIPNATVVLTSHDRLPIFSGPDPQSQVVTTTDGAGGFTFAAVVPGRYTVEARAEGAVGGGPDPATGAYVTSDSRKELSVVPGLSPSVSLSLFQLGRLRGRVRDPGGASVSGIRVVAGRVEHRDGHRWWGEVTHTTTDERGDYLLVPPRPGAYFVVADPIGPDFEGRFVPVYHDRSFRIEDAGRIQVALGAELNVDLDFAPAPSGWGAIAGRIEDRIETTRFRPVMVMLAPAGERAVLNAPEWGNRMRTAVASSGDFQIVSVPPGTYHLYARAIDPSGRQDLGQMSVLIRGAGLSDVVVPIDRLGAVVRVRLVGDVPEFPSSVNRPRLVARESRPFPFMGRVIADLDPRDPYTFTFSNVVPGTYDIDLAGWGGFQTPAYIVDVLRVGHSVMESGLAVGSSTSEDLEVVLRAGRGGGFSARILTPDGRPASGRLVLAPDIPRFRNGALLRSTTFVNRGTRPNRMGMTGLAPGRYHVFAIDENVTLEGDYLDRYRSQASPVTIEEGETSNIDVRLIR